jgi:hypothetical protein
MELECGKVVPAYRGGKSDCVIGEGGDIFRISGSRVVGVDEIAGGTLRNTFEYPVIKPGRNPIPSHMGDLIPRFGRELNHFAGNESETESIPLFGTVEHDLTSKTDTEN